MLSDVGEADALVSSRQSAPTGMQSMSVSTDFGYIHLSPVLGDFLAQHPDVSVNLELNNCYIGLKIWVRINSCITPIRQMARCGK